MEQTWDEVEEVASQSSKSFAEELAVSDEASSAADWNTLSAEAGAGRRIADLLQSVEAAAEILVQEPAMLKTGWEVGSTEEAEAAEARVVVVLEWE